LRALGKQKTSGKKQKWQRMGIKKKGERIASGVKQLKHRETTNKNKENKKMFVSNDTCVCVGLG